MEMQMMISLSQVNRYLMKASNLSVVACRNGIQSPMSAKYAQPSGKIKRHESNLVLALKRFISATTPTWIRIFANSSRAPPPSTAPPAVEELKPPDMGSMNGRDLSTLPLISRQEHNTGSDVDYKCH
jgi:hypothetical protein